MAFLDENGVAQLWAAVKDRLAGAFNSVEFDIAEQAANLMSGDSIATAFGKLAKNYTSLLTSISDLNTNLTSQINTKLNKSDVLANYTTTATGKALDASLGPAIKTKMDLADTLNTKVTALDGKLITKWTDDLIPVNNTTEKTPITSLSPDTSYWIYFPYTCSGYTIVGVLGWYFHGSGPYTTCTYYVVIPITDFGVALAFHTPPGNPITNPKGAFTVLLQKN